MSMLKACDVVSVVRLPSFVRRPDSLSDDVAFVLTWNVYSNTPFHECNGFDAGPHGHPLRSVVVLKNWKVWQGACPNSRVVAPSFRLLFLSCCAGPCGDCCHPLSSDVPIGTLCGPSVCLGSEAVVLFPLAPFVVLPSAFGSEAVVLWRGDGGWVWSLDGPSCAARVARCCCCHGMCALGGSRPSRW